MPCASVPAKRERALSKMVDKELIERIRELKARNGYTLHELSRIIDIQSSTLERWLKTGRINKIHAKVVREKLGMV